LLADLAASWDREAANSLLWDCLCHQESCYGATYAAIPHLLKIAMPEENRLQRLEIALFLGFVALCAHDLRHQVRARQFEDTVLQGLPETLEGWDRKLDCFRELVTIRKFRDLPEALLAQGRLESSGIEAFLFDDNMVRMDWLISNLLGGVKLKVEEANVEIAEEILSQEVSEDFDTTESEEDSPQPRILPFRRRWE
jgi:hypothetical protein